MNKPDYDRYGVRVGRQHLVLLVGRPKRNQPSVYRRFVESGIQDIDAAFIESKQQSHVCIGSNAFHDDIDDLYEKLVDGSTSKEDVSFRREAHTCSVEDVVESVFQVLDIDPSIVMQRQRDSLVRPLVAKALCDYAGLTQREVAGLFKLSSGGAVSKQLAKLSRLLKTDTSLQKIQKDIDCEIQNHH